METLHLRTERRMIRFCKYLTYKEWKQEECRLQPQSEQRHSDRKYLTYKEWKLDFDGVQLVCHSLCKYLTYKEWKQSRNCLSSRFHNKIVSTLPIRNGNLLSLLLIPPCNHN